MQSLECSIGTDFDCHCDETGTSLPRRKTMGRTLARNPVPESHPDAGLLFRSRSTPVPTLCATYPALLARLQLMRRSSWPLSRATGRDLLQVLAQRMPSICATLSLVDVCFLFFRPLRASSVSCCCNLISALLALLSTPLSRLALFTTCFTVYLSLHQISLVNDRNPGQAYENTTS